MVKVIEPPRGLIDLNAWRLSFGLDAEAGDSWVDEAE